MDKLQSASCQPRPNKKDNAIETNYVCEEVNLPRIRLRILVESSPGDQDSTQFSIIPFHLSKLTIRCLFYLVHIWEHIWEKGPIGK